jgi:hypothetical protein
MNCHKCNQDSIKISRYKNTEISCNICGFNIEFTDVQESLCDLFIHNENLSEAEKLGRESVLDGHRNDDNPYSVVSEQVMLHNKWSHGYTEELKSLELEGLSFSAKKLGEEITVLKEEHSTEIELLTDRIEFIKGWLRTYLISITTSVEELRDKLLKHPCLYFFPIIHMRSFMNKYNIWYNNVTSNSHLALHVPNKETIDALEDPETHVANSVDDIISL